MANGILGKVLIHASAALAIGCLAMQPARADEPRDVERETREFKISVDSKPRGQCKMTIHKRDDGSDKLHIDAGLTFDYVVYVYRYRSTGTEVWKEGRLVELENTADLNKTRYRLSAKATEKGLRLSVDGNQSDLPADAWPTSYWRIPDRLAHRESDEKSGVVTAGASKPAEGGKAKKVSLLDSDKGQNLRGEVQYVGAEMISVAGKRKSCAHYRVSGEVQVDLWYDDARRLVRQEGVESGHKTLLELTRLTTE
ncbi:MAG: hypothetical protein HY290_11945 [Planctomycetia bacterium]|nr:hypothetical protein [Planctomycetia bacterium]